MTDTLDPIRALANSAATLSATALAALQTASEAVNKVALAVASFALPASLFAAVDCDATGQTTINAAAQAAIDAGAASGAVVYFGPGRYLVDVSKPLQLRSNLILVLHPQSEFIAQTNNLARYALFSGTNVSDVIVLGNGAALYGDRLTHDYSSGGTHEWGMGFQLRNCTRVTVRDLTAREFTGDGFSVSGTDLQIINCTGIYNRRQGLSAYQGATLKVIGGTYSRNGNWNGNAGAAPMSGIDLEPDAGVLDGALIQYVTCENNGTCDIQAVSNTKAKATLRNIVITDCTLTGSPNGIEASGAGGPVEVSAFRNTLRGHKGSNVRVHSGATINVGSGDKADANVSYGIARTPAILQGEFTTGPYRYDVQVDAGGVANVGWTDYR